MHDAECKMLREVGLQDSNIKSKSLHLVIHGSKLRYHDSKGGLNGFKFTVHMNLGLIEQSWLLGSATSTMTGAATLGDTILLSKNLPVYSTL